MLLLSHNIFLILIFLYRIQETLNLSTCADSGLGGDSVKMVLGFKLSTITMFCWLQASSSAAKTFHQTFDTQTKQCWLVNKWHRYAIFGCSWIQKFNFGCLLLKLLSFLPKTETTSNMVYILWTQSPIMISGPQIYSNIFLA